MSSSHRRDPLEGKVPPPQPQLLILDTIIRHLCIPHFWRKAQKLFSIVIANAVGSLSLSLRVRHKEAPMFVVSGPLTGREKVSL